MKYFIGVDPGLTGAVAIVNKDRLLMLEDMPVMANGKGNSTIKRKVNAFELYNYFFEISLDPYGDMCGVVEQITARPGQGVSSMFSLGDSVGSVRAAISIAGIPTEYVTPQKWKKYYALPADKEYARAKAIELFPSADLSKKKHHNRAEALLLANYAKHVFGG